MVPDRIAPNCRSLHPHQDRIRSPSIQTVWKSELSTHLHLHSRWERHCKLEMEAHEFPLPLTVKATISLMLVVKMVIRIALEIGRTDARIPHDGGR